MRALYGIQGTGNGHLARARALVPALREAGVELDFVFTGRRREDYFDMEIFNGFDCFRGMSLVVRKGNLKLLGTIAGNNVVRFVRDARKLDLKPYDVVISDFEPLTAWAARSRGISSIGVSHQCAFDYAVPKVSGYRASRMIMKHFAPTGIRLGLHWHHFGQPVLPPLITCLEPKEADRRKVLVYMMWEALDDLIEFVKPFSGRYDFLIYVPVREERTFGSIRVRPLSYMNFHRDMQDCNRRDQQCRFRVIQRMPRPGQESAAQAHCRAIRATLQRPGLAVPAAGDCDKFAGSRGAGAMARTAPA